MFHLRPTSPVLCTVTPVLTTTHCTKTVFCWGLRAVLIRVQRQEFRGQFDMMSNQQIVVGSLLRPVSSPAMGSWPDLQYKVCVSSCAAGLKSKRKAVGCTYNLCATIAPMGISWCTDVTAVHGVHSWISRLKTGSLSPHQPA